MVVIIKILSFLLIQLLQILSRMRRKFQRIQKLLPQSSRISQRSEHSEQCQTNKFTVLSGTNNINTYKPKHYKQRINKREPINSKQSQEHKQNEINQFSFNELDFGHQKEAQNFLRKQFCSRNQQSKNGIQQIESAKALKDDLMNLQKEEIVELLIDQIQENRILYIRIRQQSQLWQHSELLSNSSRRQSDRQSVKLKYQFRKSQHKQSQVRPDGQRFNRRQADQVFSYSQMSQTSDKYAQLVEYMNQYIRNTNQAQQHFFYIIQNLKRSNQSLKQTNKKLNFEKRQLQIDTLRKIQQLEKSIVSYLTINNQLTAKLQKQKKRNESLQHFHWHPQQIGRQLEQEPIRNAQKDMNAKQWNSKQLFSSCATNAIHQPNNCKEVLNIPSFISIQDPEKPENNLFDRSNSFQQKPDICSHQSSSHQIVKQLQGRIKLLEIQNRQIKQRQISAERMLENKSDKVRQLLSQLQRSSEQKWSYKQQVLYLKSKQQQFQSTCCKSQKL